MGGGSEPATHSVTFDTNVTRTKFQVFDVSNGEFVEYDKSGTEDLVVDQRYKRGDMVIFRHWGVKSTYYATNTNDYTYSQVTKLDNVGTGNNFAAYAFVMPDADAVVSTLIYQPPSGDDSGGDSGGNSGGSGL